jgi:S1-C subfamily serine protease
MNMRSSAIVRSALLAVAAAVAMASATAAEVEKKPADSQAEMEKKLADARRRLDSAAREVAQLSMSLSDQAVPQMRQIGIIGGRRAVLGIVLSPPGDDVPDGVAIASVSPGGAAEQAGLKAGDVLLAIGDKQLKRFGHGPPHAVLMDELRRVEPGEKVQLRYRRDDKVATATVTAEPADRMFFTAPTTRGMLVGPGMPLPPLAALRVAGVFGSAELVPLTPQLGRYFGTEKGLLVVRAPSDSRLKLEDGDVIVDIDGRVPSSPTHAFRILGSYQAGEKLTLNVLRQKKKMSFDITVPDEMPAARTNPFLFHQQFEGPMIDGGDTVMFQTEPGLGPMTAPVPPPPPGAPDEAA